MLNAYLRLHDFIARHRAVVLVLLGCLYALSLAIAPRLPLDMSFRPLFVDDPAAAAATARFEAALAQSSGAHLVAILEADDVREDGFRRRLAALTDRVAAIAHVAEAMSAPKLSAAWPTPLISADNRRALLLARLDLPLADLAGRRPVIEDFRRVVDEGVPPATRVRITGVSVVESAYADLVLRNMAIGVGLTVLGVCAALFVFLGSLRGAAIAIAAVSVATPLTFALMVLLGQSMTIVNSMVATMVLILGVADAIHMQESFLEHRSHGLAPEAAVRAMLAETALPCAMTCAFTAVGFFSLGTASIPATRDFGVNVGLGVLIVYVANQLLVPALLAKFGPQPGHSSERIDAWIRAWSRRSVGVVLVRSRALLWIAALVAAGSMLAVTRLDVVQRFNEELARDHPVREAQRILEEQFGGILGPELSVRRRDGDSLLQGAGIASLRALQAALRGEPHVLSTRSIADHWDAAPDARALLAARADSPLRFALREVIDASGRWGALIVRTDDMGTFEAARFHGRVLELARRELGPDYVVEVVGQWWLAQQGMLNLVDDMYRSLLTSGLVMLPFMALLLRSFPLFAASLLPNVLPMLAALAFMALTGITLRIGTAIVLASSLGIALDDSIHFMLRLRREAARGAGARAAVQRTVSHTGKAVLLSTVVLVVGFLGMVPNDLLAIRDMGLVAVVAYVAGLLADVYLAPALFLRLVGAGVTGKPPIRKLPGEGGAALDSRRG